MKTLILALLLIPATLVAQDSLTIDRALALALDNNYGIVVARNNTEISKNNAAPGNAGLLPTVSASGNYNYSLTNSTLEFAGDIPPNEIDGAQSIGMGASLGMNYTLFDGMGTIYNYQKLKTASDISEDQARLEIENTLMQVLNAYYEVARLQGNKENAMLALSISQERLKRANVTKEFGTGTRLQVLNAKVDLNTDSVNLVNADAQLGNAMRTLNYLLGGKGGEDTPVSTKVTYTENLSLAGLRNRALSNNAALVVASGNLSLARLDVKTSQSGRYPRLAASASYGYNRNQNDASIVLDNQSLGFSGGLTLNFDIFDGNRRKIAVQNARIALENSQQLQEQSRMLVDKDVTNGWFTYQSRLAVLNAEQTGVRTAQLNFDKTRDLFNLGQATNTDFRQAQLNLLRAQNRLNDARYLAKLAELDCLRLSGDLLRQE